MIEYIEKDITTVTKGIVAHGVNCQGVMRSGVAKAIREKWPKVYEEYENMSATERHLGVAQVIKLSQKFDSTLIVLNCFTQFNFGRDGKRYADPGAIRESLSSAATYAYAYDSDLYMPRIGCGLGGLDWDLDVLPIVEELSASFDIDIYICDLPQ